ncbi:hypothetical protein [Novosphingobium sp. BL-52-GroH]|uniref:hypothetical protein n=1 Tax=Novosphingobium sp. BL-52-GroH TaxID=3349877 RepID=UPI00384D7C6F
MAEITIDRDAYEKLKSGDGQPFSGDSKLATFLAHKFEEGEAAQRSKSADEASWVYNIWTYSW